MAADYAYALVQVAHNFGAVAVVGSPAAAWLWSRKQRDAPTLLLGLVIAGWLVQVLSGVGFGVTSLYARGELPEVTGVALLALYVKVGCAAGGLALASYQLILPPQKRRRAMPVLLSFGVVALTAAAFLRWFG